MGPRRKTMKVVCIDAEFTGEHAYTTLVSLGLVTLEGEELYLTLNDFDQNQVTDWLNDNVLSMINEQQSLSSFEAFERLHLWLEAYREGQPIHLVTAGKGADIILMFELYHQAHPEREYFHYLHCLPEYLNHSMHFDLNTLLFAAGADLSLPREVFIGKEETHERHNAIFDARIVRECFLKLLDDPTLAFFSKKIGYVAKA